MWVKYFATEIRSFALKFGQRGQVVTFLFLKVSIQFTVVFIIFSTADNCFEFLVLISTERETKNYLKN